jgi:protein gp37
MSAQSKIAWTDATWNPWIGCAKVSPGCKSCYAENETFVRVQRSKGRELWGGKERHRTAEATFNAPLRWNQKPWVCDNCGHCQTTEESKSACAKCVGNDSSHKRRVFSLSLGDWLDEAITIEWLADMLDVIRRCPNLDFLLLTKRPENWRDRIEKVILNCTAKDTDDLCEWLHHWQLAGSDNAGVRSRHSPPQNIWIGTTVENQEYADKRIPELLKIPAVCHFVSQEPQLGPVDYSLEWLAPFKETDPMLNRTPRVDWIIVGGESGPKARPFSIDWARQTVRQCKEAGVACFVKQIGAMPFEAPEGITPYTSGPDAIFCIMWNLDDKKGGNMSEWPEDLKVREFPINKAK